MMTSPLRFRLSGQFNLGTLMPAELLLREGEVTLYSVYSATEAAALIFGGVASGYDISTLGINPFDINNMGWYTIWGVGGGTMFAEDYKLDLGAPGYNDPGGANTAISAYTWDNAQGAQYTNYVFLVDPSNNVPEPASLALIGLGLAGLGVVRRKNRKQGAV